MMKKHNRLISVLLALALVMSVVLAAPVTASADGDDPGEIIPPPGDWSYVTMTRISDDGRYAYDEHGDFSERYDIYVNGQVGAALPRGVSFDPETFTVGLSDFEGGDLELAVRTIADKEVTVTVSGDCELGRITMISETQEPRMRIAGEGSLIVNGGKTLDYAITMSSFFDNATPRDAWLKLGEDVSVQLYGATAPVSIMGRDADLNPFIAENGDEIGCTTEPYCYETDVPIVGYVDADNLPDGSYPRWVGSLIENDNDPDGIYCKGDDDTVQKLYYDKNHDLYVVDGSVDLVTFDEEVHHFVYNEYGDLQSVRTQNYDSDTYYVVEDVEGDPYLIEPYRWNVSGCDLMETDVYPFAYVGSEDLVDESGSRYAVTLDETKATFRGENHADGAAEVKATVTGIRINKDQKEYLGYRCERTVGPDNGYVYVFREIWGEDDEMRYEVSRYIDVESVGYLFADSSYRPITPDPEGFFYDFDPTVDEHGEYVWVCNERRLREMDGDAYEDADGKRYVCDFRYNNVTDEMDCVSIYSYEEIPELYDEKEDQKYYLFEPAEGVDTAKLKRATQVVKTDNYRYMPEASELIYNVDPNKEKVISELDLGNFWTFNLISSNPFCEPCYIPFTGEVREDIEGAKVDDQIWTNTEDGSYSSAKTPSALKPGYQYRLSAVVTAEPGYRFSDPEKMTFTYLGEASEATLTLSEDQHTLTVDGLEEVTFLLDTPELLSAEPSYGGVLFRWEGSGGAENYRVFRKEAGKSWTAIADTADTEYLDTTAVSNTSYTYTARCVSADGSRYASAYDKTGKSVSYVAAPKIKKIENAYTGVKLTLTKPAGAAKVRIFKKNDAGKWTKLADTTATTYTDTTAENGSDCCYTVRAINASGQFCSGFNTEGREIRFVAAPKITKIENVNGGMKLTITPVEGTAQYRVFVKSGSSGWKTVTDTDELTVTNKNVKSGTAYTYTVRGLDENGKYISGYNTSGWKYTYIAPPALPTLKNTKNGVQITYTKPAGGTYFRIFRKTGSGKWTKLTDTSSATYVDKSAKNGTKYSYTIRCINKAGTKYLSGYNSTGKAITCKR